MKQSQLVPIRVWNVIAGALCVCAPAVAEPTFRVRTDATAPLNAPEGWAGKAGEKVTVQADKPFRLRIESLTNADGSRLVLQTRRNGGEWQRLEAHDFPYPTRELNLNYKNVVADKMLDGWQLINGPTQSFSIRPDSDQRQLSLLGGPLGLMARRSLPWPAASDISISATMRLPVQTDSVSLLWGMINKSNYHAARFRGTGEMELINVVDGKEAVVARVKAEPVAGAYREVEIESEAGQLQIAIDGNEIFNGPFASNPGEPGVAVASGKRVDFTKIGFQGVARTPQVSIIASQGYVHGSKTSDLLNGSTLPFVSGIGTSLQETVEGSRRERAHSEFEWPLVIRRYADGPAVSQTGDVFQFRMVSTDGTEPHIGPLASVTLKVPDGHLGGTFVETPGRIGPWQASNGDLYFIMEPSETDNKFMMMKSRDGGKSWQEMDGMNRPRTGDLEAVDSRLVGNSIHIIHQVTRSVRHHVFQTSDHPAAPDTWALRDEVAVAADSIAQMASMAVRSDGSIVAFFLADRLHFVIRGADGIWMAPIELDTDLTFINTGPQAILGRDDIIHLAYSSDDGRIWYRKMFRSGKLAARQLLASGAGTGRREYGAVLPLAYDAATDTVVIVFRLTDGSLWERRIIGSSEPSRAVMITSIPTITNAVDSQQPAADIAMNGGKSVLLFVDGATRSLWSSSADKDRWQSPVIKVKDIEGSWVRGNIIRRSDGGLAYGYVYDAGSKGGTGRNRYAEVPLQNK